MTSLVLGLRSKTARAVGVALLDAPDGPEIAWRGELATCDPEVEGSEQPHHLGLELTGARAELAVARAERAVRRSALRSLRATLGELERAGHSLRRVAVIGPPRKGPELLAKMGNPHVRAHAAEGQLFRSCLEEAAAEVGLACVVESDRDFLERATRVLRCPRASLEKQIAALGRAIGPPFRADHKLATAAAWRALYGPER